MSPPPVALAPDPVVPQRDRLLDPDAMVPVLSLRLGRGGSVPIRSCRIGHITYRPGKRLRVLYRIRIDGREMKVAASTFPTRDRGERAYREAMETGRESRSLRPAGYDADLKTVFCAFPNDRTIENLPAVTEARQDLTRLVDLRWAGSRLVDYKPEISAVVGCLDDSGRVIGYAKVHAGDEGQHVFEVQRSIARLAQGAGPRIARPLAYSKPHRTLLVEPIMGTPIRHLSGGGVLAGLHAYGAALARLHSLAPRGFAGRFGTGGRDTLERLRHRAGGILAVRPDVREQVAELLEELAVRWGGASEPRVLIHGDANDRNAILEGDHVVLLDLDRSRVGAAAADVGNFLSLLRYFRLLGLVSTRTECARAAAFADGYSSVRALPAVKSLRVHESAALVERAFRSVTRLRGPALRRVPAVLAEARGLLR